MKNSKICPKCGGQDITIMRSDLNITSDPRVRVKGSFFQSYEDFLPVERHLCCTCGYMESWIDPEDFIKKGGKSYWTEQEDIDAYWREKLREKREKEAQEERAREKEKKNRREDPWT